MRMTLAIHVIAGTLGLIAGYIALFAAKGATLHRRSGMVFIYAMLAMCIGGALIAIVRNVAPSINIPAAILTTYLFTTAVATVHPSVLGSRPWAVGLMLVALGVGVTMLTFGLEAIANGGLRNGMPAFPFFMFGVVGMLGFIGDLRVVRSGALTGSRRLARHLWRMSFALFLAALSFSVQAVKLLGQRGIRIPGGLMALPMLVVLVAMSYWLWRVRIRKSLRGIVRLSAPEAA
jgi:uncharacterized membrane protein